MKIDEGCIDHNVLRVVGMAMQELDFRKEHDMHNGQEELLKAVSMIRGAALLAQELKVVLLE